MFEKKKEATPTKNISLSLSNKVEEFLDNYILYFIISPFSHDKTTKRSSVVYLYELDSIFDVQLLIVIPIQTSLKNSFLFGFGIGKVSKKNLYHFFYTMKTALLIIMLLCSNVYATDYILSFDDWPNEWTMGIAKNLSEKKRVWHFYLIGQKVIQNQEIVSNLHNMGHIVCNHTRSHRDLTKLSYREVKRELLLGAIAIKEATWEAPNCWRPPFGKTNKLINDYAKSIGMDLHWSLAPWVFDSLDWRFKDAWMITKRLSSARWYKEIVFHDSQWTLEVIKKM